MSGNRIAYHPVLAVLTADSVPGSPQPEAVVKLSGYVGPASQQGLVRIYTALEDLSHYLEFDEEAVVHTEDTPGAEMSDNASSLWVKASTPVRWIREYASAGILVASIKNTMMPVSGAGGGTQAS
jgi:hypothetical protein